jgi:hypothetical protein
MNINTAFSGQLNRYISIRRDVSDDVHLRRASLFPSGHALGCDETIFFAEKACF